MERTLMGCCSALLLAGCGLGIATGPQQDQSASESQPILSGDACALHRDAQSCDADTQDKCHWLAFGAPTGAPTGVCPQGAASCPTGVCVGPSPVTDGGCGPVPLAGSSGSTTNVCAQHKDQVSCDADTKDDCYWFATACPVLADGGSNGCPPGACVQRLPPPCGNPDAGSISAACACPVAVASGGSTTAVQSICVEQIGGPAVSPGQVAIQCVPLPGVCDPTTTEGLCGCVPNQGKCTPSPNVSGLCICDNGIR